MAVRAGEVMMGAEAREEARENAGTVGIVTHLAAVWFVSSTPATTLAEKLVEEHAGQASSRSWRCTSPSRSGRSCE